MCASALATFADQVQQSVNLSFLAGSLDSPIGTTPQTAGIAEGSSNQGQDGSAGRGRGRGGQKVSQRPGCLVASILKQIYMALDVSKYSHLRLLAELRTMYCLCRLGSSPKWLQDAKLILMLQLPMKPVQVERQRMTLSKI